MQRTLVRITGTTHRHGNTKLIGHKAIRYEDSPILAELLRLSPEAREDNISGYIEAEYYTVEDIGPVPTITFDEADVCSV